MKVFLILVLLGFKSFGSTSDCSVDPKDSLSLITSQNSPRPEDTKYPQQEWVAHLDLAKRFWEFLNLNRDQENIKVDGCLPPPLNSTSFNQALSQIFFKKSMTTIKELNPELFEKIQKKKNLDQILFSAFAKCEKCEKANEPLLDGNRPAQYSLQTKSILSNISKLSMNDWRLIFIHEIGHHIDSIEGYSKAFLSINSISKIRNYLASYPSISNFQQTEIDSWILNGIGMKLLAEWRIWSFTLFYIEAHKEFEFGKQTEWLRNFHQLPKDIKYKELFKVLEPKFVDPTTGMESHPFILERIKVIREKLRKHVESGEIQPLDFL